MAGFRLGRFGSRLLGCCLLGFCLRLRLCGCSFLWGDKARLDLYFFSGLERLVLGGDARVPEHAGDRFTWLSALHQPIQGPVLPDHHSAGLGTGIVVADDLDEATISWRSLVGNHNSVARLVLCAHSAQSNSDHIHLFSILRIGTHQTCPADYWNMDMSPRPRPLCSCFMILRICENCLSSWFT